MADLTFLYRSRLAASAERVFAWHAEPGALARLTPPWEPVEVVGETGGLTEGTEVTLAVRVGPVTLPWIARIDGVVPGREFRDVQVRGPFARWEHTHRMVPIDGSSCWLEDRIVYALPVGFLGRWGGGWFVRRKLARLFEYRHRVTAEAVRPFPADTAPGGP